VDLVIDPDTPVLVVSPHLDDAVLSAFAFLRRSRATVLTVFCGAPCDGRASSWDVALGQTDGADAMRMRLAEDDTALGDLGVATTRLPLLETEYRRGAMSRDDEEQLLAAVRTWVDSTAGVVLLPAGAGARDSLLYRARWQASRPPLRVPGGGEPHPDHVAVRDIVAPAVLADGGRLALYEELPYRWTGRGDSRVAALRRRLGARTRRFHVPIDANAKARAIETYGSQIPELFRPWVRDISRELPARERYWLVSPR
jgi:LmbE family N-acetylglucosaminyl deacetylase